MVLDPFLKEFALNIDRGLIPVNFSEPTQIKLSEEEVLRKLDNTPEPPSPHLLVFLTNRIKTENNPIINKREARSLPWTLFYGESPRLIETPVKYSYVLQIINNSFNVRYLKDLVYVYLSNYDPQIKGCEEIRKLIWDKLDDYEINNKINKRVSFLLKNRNPIFLPNGHNQTASILLNKEGDVDSLLSEHGLDKGLDSSKYVKLVSHSMIELTKKNFPNNLNKCLSINEFPGDQSKPKFKDLISKMASDFLEVAENSEQEIKEKLSNYFLRYLKDPRIPGNSIHWQGVSDNAKKIFCQWLSSKDLEFFFNIVDRTSADTKWEYRRKFWEAYLPKISNTWVILGREAKRLAVSSRLGSETNRYGDLVSGSSRHSVFLIEMGGYVFIEWNDSGACRIVKAEECPFKFYKKQYTTAELKVSQYEHKVIHSYAERYGWQEKLRRWIRDKTNKNIYIDEEDYKLD
ncbi:EH signature domain-containing protein [Nitrospinae bacterium]|nr:EH signature domain-containing protein [Nitrospinota bacterium]